MPGPEANADLDLAEPTAWEDLQEADAPILEQRDQLEVEEPMSRTTFGQAQREDNSLEPRQMRILEASTDWKMDC